MLWSSISHTAVSMCIKLSWVRLQFWPQTYFLHSLTLDKLIPVLRSILKALASVICGSTFSSGLVCLAKSQAGSLLKCRRFAVCWVALEEMTNGSLSVWDNEPPGNYRANFDHPLRKSASCLSNTTVRAESHSWSSSCVGIPFLRRDATRFSVTTHILYMCIYVTHLQYANTAVTS